MKRALLIAATLFAAGTPAIAREAAPRVPERQAFVAAAHPLAVEAGLDVLRRGGNAIDAAVAVQAMLGLVEPQSSGLGGGAFLVHYDAATRKVSVYDGRETAPAGATPDMFLDDGGQPIPFRTAVLSGSATGIPGAVAMLALAHKERGKLGWGALFADSERVARDGFTVSARLERFVHGPYPQSSAPDVVRYFSDGKGGKVRAGDTLRNPAYAAFVHRLASEGPRRPLSRRDRKTHRRAPSRRRPREQHDRGGSRGLQTRGARGGVQRLPHLYPLRPAAAVERRRPARADGDDRA